MLKVVLLSSLSNQLSFLHYADKKNKNINDFFIFIFPPSNTLNSSIRPIHESLLCCSHCWIIKSYFLKCILLMIFKITHKFNFIYFYLSRPLWERSIIGSSFLRKIKSFFLPPSLNKNNVIKLKNCIFFGDGFSLYCPNVKPFWLLSKNEKLPILRFENCEFYAAYSLEKKGYVKLGISSTTFNTLKDSYIEKCIQENLDPYSDCDEVFVFTGTTFSKSLRTSPEKEASLYFDFISKYVNKNKLIILKFHPNGIPLVNKLLINSLSLSGFNFVHSDVLDAIPIEFIYMYLSKLELNKVEVTCSTTGSYFASFINDDFLRVFGYGDDLIKKYLNNSFIESRLEQERNLIEIDANNS